MTAAFGFAKQKINYLKTIKMARQKGIIKLKGTIGDVTFYKTKDGHLAKEKTSLDGARILNDPAFVRTKENGREFGEAAKDGKLLRDALRPNMVTAHDKRVTSRLTQLFVKILKLDATSARGARTVGNAIALPSAMAMLKGFNFNIRAILGEVLIKPHVLNTGTGVITINGLVPINDLTAAAGATHVSLRGAWGKVDFTGKIYDVQQTNVVNLPIDGTLTNVVLTPAAAPVGPGTNVYLLQVEFYQLVNTIQYSLKNGAFNALGIIDVA
jgi:hypothetical protein